MSERQTWTNEQLQAQLDEWDTLSVAERYDLNITFHQGGGKFPFPGDCYRLTFADTVVILTYTQALAVEAWLKQHYYGMGKHPTWAAAIAPDRQYRGIGHYEYGRVRSIQVEVILSEQGGDILWGYQLPELATGCGGFSGPFEALAHALAYAREAGA